MYCQHRWQNNHQSPLADEFDGLTGEEEELAKSVVCLDKVPTAYGMQINAEKT